MSNKKKSLYLIFGPFILLILTFILNTIINVFSTGFSAEPMWISIIKNILTILGSVCILGIVPCLIIGVIYANKKDENLELKKKDTNKDYSSEEIVNFSKKLKTIKKIQYFYIFPLLLFTLFLLKFLKDYPETQLFEVQSKYFFIFGFVMVIILPILSYRNWRCPACKSYFGSNFNPDKCDKCGIEL